MLNAVAEETSICRSFANSFMKSIFENVYARLELMQNGFDLNANGKGANEQNGKRNKNRK